MNAGGRVAAEISGGAYRYDKQIVIQKGKAVQLIIQPGVPGRSADQPGISEGE
jgi:hypothetical protein